METDKTQNLSGSDGAIASAGGRETAGAVEQAQQMAQQAVQGVQQTAQQAVQGAQQQAQEALSQAQEAAGHVYEQVKDQVGARLSSEKDRALDGISILAQSLRQTSRELDNHGQPVLGGYVETAAEQAERLAAYLKERDLGALAQDVGSFARNRPALFLGGAFVLGMMSARFFKSGANSGSRPHHRMPEPGRPVQPAVLAYVREHNAAQV